MDNNKKNNDLSKEIQNLNEFTKERTEVFDKIKEKKTQSYNTKIVQADITGETKKKKPSNTSSQFYNLKGNQIQSGRQKLTNANVNTNAPRRNRPLSEEEIAQRRRQRQQNQQGHGRERVRGENVQSRPRKKPQEIVIGKKRKKTKKREGFVLSGIFKVIFYIGIILSISGVLSYNIINIANDIFAFVKTPIMKTVTVPEGADIEKVAEILHENGLISYPKAFVFYAGFRKKDDPSKLIPGEYLLDSTYNYDDFLFEFRYDKSLAQTVSVVIPEGYTIDQIIDLFVSKNIGTRAKFVEVINNNKFNYKFLDLLDSQILSPDRKYRLEGYLFPDTYDFYTTSSESYVIDTLLKNFNTKFNELYYTRCEAINMSVDEVIALASIIEREAKFPDDFTIISSVFHNRLLSPNFPYLESDATIQYSFDKHKSDLTGEDLQQDLPYNTYTNKGLPPSAICNPGYEAIYAALFPDTTDYYYFVHDKSGKTYYAETYNEHIQNINTARAQE